MPTLVERMESLKEQFTELQTEVAELRSKRAALVEQIEQIDAYLEGTPPPKPTPIPRTRAKQAPAPQASPKRAPTTTTWSKGISEAIRQVLADGETRPSSEIYEIMEKAGFEYTGERHLYKAVSDGCKNMAAVGMLVRVGNKYHPRYRIGRQPIHPGNKSKRVKAKKDPKPAAGPFPHPVPKPFFTDPNPLPKPAAKRKDDCVNAVLESVRLLTGLDGDRWVRVKAVKDLLDKDGVILKGVKDPAKKIHNVLYRLGMSGRLERDPHQQGYRLPLAERK